MTIQLQPTSIAETPLSGYKLDISLGATMFPFWNKASLSIVAQHQFKLLTLKRCSKLRLPILLGSRSEILEVGLTRPMCRRLRLPSRQLSNASALYTLRFETSTCLVSLDSRQWGLIRRTLDCNSSLHGCNIQHNKKVQVLIRRLLIHS